MIKLVQYLHTSDVYEDGINYVYNMMIDYEKVVTEYDARPLNVFLREWNVIPADSFAYLSKGDVVFDCVGNRYQIEDDDVRIDDEDNLIVDARLVQADGSLSTFIDTFVGGDLYYKPFYHDASILMPKKTKGESKICPILITSQAQPQS